MADHASVESRIGGKNPKRVLPQWKRNARIQRQRLQVAGVGAVLCVAVGLAAYLIQGRLTWLQLVCAIGFPIQLLAFLADGHLYRQRLADVAELEAIIAALESGKPGS